MTKHSLCFVCVMMVAMAFAAAQCQASGMTLFLQQSPFEGGVVTPSPGVHLFTSDANIELTAVPKPGYQFVCWLGDVGDATATTTMTYLDKPKVIVAVFERCPYEDLYGGGGSTSGVASNEPVGGGFSHHATGGGGFTPTPDPIPDPDPEPDPVPDPDPTPEPATILLLGSGVLMLLRKRRA